VIAGPAELMAQARVAKHRFGGAMRQAGIVAAAGLYALEHNVARLADDHRRARRLAEGWEGRGVPVAVDLVETNFVQVDAGALGLDTAEALARLAREDVGLSATVKPGVLRAVTHLDVGDDDVERALELVPRALGVLARA
jgi:threonine aldolase